MFILIIILVTYFIYIPKKNTKKILKYFGGHKCPYSRIGSRAYELIKEFELQYPEINVEYYWSGEDKEEFKLGNIKYVPTIENCNYEKIELKLQDNIDTTDKTEDELIEILMKNIYDQL